MNIANKTYISYIILFTVVLSLFFINKRMHDSIDYKYVKYFETEYHDLVMAVILTSLFFVFIGHERLSFEDNLTFGENGIRILSFIIPLLIMVLVYPSIEKNYDSKYLSSSEDDSKYISSVTLYSIIGTCYIVSYIYLTYNNSYDYADDVKKLLLSLSVIAILFGIVYNKLTEKYNSLVVSSNKKIHDWFIFYVFTITNVLRISYNQNKYFNIFSNIFTGLTLGGYLSSAFMSGHKQIISIFEEKITIRKIM